MENHNLENFAKVNDLKFKDINLLRQVFVHRSYLNENPGFDLDHNERLEFLGDAVLELVVTEYLYNNYKNPEGELTNLRSALVKGSMLSRIAQELNMDQNLFLSRGEAKSQGKSRQLILANTFEALIGAIYMDKGYDEAKKFIEAKLIHHIKEIISQKLYLDPKSHLQELAQEKLSSTPMYKVISEDGPDHDKKFLIGCYIKDKLYGQGEGSSKQAAESAAAANTLKDFK